MSTDVRRPLRFCRQLERHAGDALDLTLLVDIRVEAPATAVVHADAARFAKIDAAGEFADDQDVEVRDQFRLFSEDASANGANNSAGRRLANKSKPERMPKQTLFRALIHGQVVPLRAAHRTEQHGVRGACAAVKRIRRQRRAMLVDGVAAQDPRCRTRTTSRAPPAHAPHAA